MLSDAQTQQFGAFENQIEHSFHFRDNERSNLLRDSCIDCGDIAREVSLRDEDDYLCGYIRNHRAGKDYDSGPIL